MTTTLIRFDGNRLKYKAWRRQVFNVARLSSTDNFGLVPFGLTAAQIAALPNPAQGGGTAERRLYSFPLSPDLNRSPDVCIASTMMLDYTGFQPHIIAVISSPHQ
jgi:hypothetical protein